jgi:hypothetical protein
LRADDRPLDLQAPDLGGKGKLSLEEPARKAARRLKARRKARKKA